MASKTKWAGWYFEAGRDNTGSDADLVLGSIRGETAEGSYHLARVWNDAPDAERTARLMTAALGLFEALTDLVNASDENDGEFGGDALDLLRNCRDVGITALRAADAKAREE